MASFNDCRLPEQVASRSVDAQPFFTTIAGLAVSLAGFGAVIGWLREDPSEWDPINLWRVKTIVRHAFTIAFICLALVPIYSFTQDEAMTIRIGSATAPLFAFFDIWRVRRPDPAVWDPVSWRVFVTIIGILAVLGVVNIFWASLGMLQLLILAFLNSPAGIFTNFVREMGTHSRAEAAADPGE